MHALQATTLAGTVYFAGYALLSLLGIVLQDRKLRLRWHDEYASYQAQTGTVFRLQNLSRVAQPLRTWLAAIVVTLLLFVGLHPLMAYANGAGFALFILIFGILATVAALARGQVAQQP